MVFCPEHPKRDQNLKFTPLSETTSIPVPFLWESPPPPTGVKGTYNCFIYPELQRLASVSRLYQSHALTSLPLSSHAFSKSHTTKHRSICRPLHPPPLVEPEGSFPMKVTVADPGEGQTHPLPPPPLIFKSNWGPKSRKIFWGNPPPLIRHWVRCKSDRKSRCNQRRSLVHY